MIKLLLVEPFRKLNSTGILTILTLAAGLAWSGPNANAKLYVDLDYTNSGIDSVDTIGTTGTVWIGVRIANAIYLDTYGFYLSYDTAKVSFKRAASGTIGFDNLLETRNGTSLFIGKISRDDSTQVTIGNSLIQSDSSHAASGSGLLALFEFNNRGVAGEAHFTISQVRLLNWDHQEDSVKTVYDARLILQTPSPILTSNRHWEFSSTRLQKFRQALVTNRIPSARILLGQRSNSMRP